MKALNDFILLIDGYIWGLPLIILVIGTGVLLTCRLNLLQVFHLPRALVYMFKNEEDGHGEVTSFGALCTALSATIGTGNIVGVATAVTAGGPGAIFWMLLAAFFGMATKYAEGLLAVKYRTIDDEGHVLGGPFYYIERGMGKNWRWLAKLFALFGTMAGLLGIGTITQVNGVASAVKGVFDPDTVHTLTLFDNTYSWATAITAVVVSLLAGLVIIGGIKRIASVSQVVVPFMAVLYFLACIFILLTHITEIPGAIKLICTTAFTGTAAVGGFTGAIVKQAIQSGVARGIFSNESGLGSAPIAAAAAQTKYPARQGLVSMTGTFLDTIIICNLTGLSIVVTGAWSQGLKGVEVTNYAFREGFAFAPFFGQVILAISLAFFAFTTILGWSYYSERCLEYLTNRNMAAVKIYKFLYIFAVLIGPFLTVEIVWNIADVTNGLMAFPNLIALIFLSGVVSKETKGFFQQHPTLNAK